MKLFPCISDPVDQGSLHEAVNILLSFIDCQGSVIHILQDPGQSFDNTLPLLFGKDSLLCQHGGMYDTAGDIFVKQSFIKCYGRVEIKYQLIGLFRKTSSP